MNFLSCSDHSRIINDFYIFFPYIRVWVFLFLRTSFFTAQKRWSYGTVLHSCTTKILIKNATFISFLFYYITVGFYGKTNIEMARIDFICDCFYEILDDFLRMYNEKDPTRKVRDELSTPDGR